MHVGPAQTGHVDMLIFNLPGILHVGPVQIWHIGI